MISDTAFVVIGAVLICYALLWSPAPTIDTLSLQQFPCTPYCIPR